VAGYANRVIHIPFPDLTDDPEGDPIWLSIRNPQYMAPSEMRPKDLPQGPDGQPEDPTAAIEAMYEVYSKLILGWRVYDPDSIRVDPDTGELADMERMPSPPTPRLVAKLPMVILAKLSEVVKEAVNPPSKSEKGGTTKTLSSPPNQSTAERGPVVPFPERSATLS
jgi:hypothetical protein